MRNIEPRTIDAFHAHLDVCDRCRDRPFDLCADGEDLLGVGARSVPVRSGVEARSFDMLPSERVYKLLPSLCRVCGEPNDYDVHGKCGNRGL